MRVTFSLPHRLTSSFLTLSYVAETSSTATPSFAPSEAAYFLIVARLSLNIINARISALSTVPRSVIVSRVPAPSGANSQVHEP